MRTVEEFFYKNVDIPLYHYTGIDAILSIAQTSSLWSSSISYLNDSSEMIHALEVMQKIITISGRPETLEERKLLEQLDKYCESCKTVSHTIFVFSLSEVGSLLSQWRSYTPHGKGVSLEFSAEKTNFIATNSNLKIARCIYEQVEQEELIYALIDKLLISFQKELPHINVNKWHESQSYSDFIIKYSEVIFQVLSIIKHSAFSEEREWRLISPYFQKYTDPTIKFRSGASMLVPYIELGLGEKPYFSNMVLGPSQYQNLSMSSLGMLISNSRICPQITNCSIPYREW